MGDRRQAADRPQETGVGTFQNEGAKQQCQREPGNGRDGAQQDQRVIVQRQHRSEQHMQQVHAAALQRHDQHATGQTDQIKRCHAGIFPQRSDAGDKA